MSKLKQPKHKVGVSHRRSRHQEKELSIRSGGQVVPGSGSSYQKGDVKKAFKGMFRLEAKTTQNKSFSVTRDMLRKIEDAALSNNEYPAIVVEFINERGEPVGELAVMPTYVLAALGEINENDS